jgi:hypothetical protein
MDGFRVADRAGKSARDTGPSTVLSHAAQTESLAPHAPPCGQTGLTHVFPGACGATRSAPHSPRRGCARKRTMPDVGGTPAPMRSGLIACLGFHNTRDNSVHATVPSVHPVISPSSRPTLAVSGRMSVLVEFARFVVETASSLRMFERSLTGVQNEWVSQTLDGECSGDHHGREHGHGSNGCCRIDPFRAR